MARLPQQETTLMPRPLLLLMEVTTMALMPRLLLQGATPIPRLPLKEILQMPGSQQQMEISHLVETLQLERISQQEEIQQMPGSQQQVEILQLGEILQLEKFLQLE